MPTTSSKPTAARQRRVGWAQVLAILAVAVSAAACSSDPPPAPTPSGNDDAARTAEVDQEAPSTRTAKEDSAAPAGAGAGRFDIDQDTTTREVFDTLTGAEQACIREAIDEDLLEAVLDAPVLSEDEDGMGGSVTSILSCLAPDAARKFFLSVAKATMVAAAAQEGLSAPMGEDEEACMRDLLTGVDVAALASEPESGNFEEFDVSGLIGLSDLSLGLFSCVPDVLVASMGGLTPEQESCVRGLMADVAAGDYRSVLASDPELDTMLESYPELAGLGPLLGLSFDLLACTLDDALDSEPVDPSPVPGESDGNDGTGNDGTGTGTDGTGNDGTGTGNGTGNDGTGNDGTGTGTDGTGTGNGGTGTGNGTGNDGTGTGNGTGNDGTGTGNDLDVDPPPDPDKPDNAAPDDHGDVLDRATSVGVGEAVPGAIDGDGDIDYFVFQAEQGMHYQIDVALGTLAGSTTTLHDDAAFELASYFENPSRDDYYDPYDASRLPWSAEYTGEHFVAVESFSGNTGKYTLTVVLDDHADVLDRATSAGVGEAVPGAIDGDGDVDFFVFRAEQGMHYRIDVALGTLPDSTATLHHLDGYGLAHSDDYVNTAASRIDWLAEYTGDHYVAVRGPEGSTGTYTLTVTPVADHADVLDRATSVSVGETVPGVIYSEGDIDFFLFRAEQGMRYQIDVALGTLPSSTATLYDPDGFKLTSSDDYVNTAASRIRWLADYSGDHYVAVRGPWGNTGTYTYTVTVTLDAFPDDHADVLDRATSTGVGETVPGAIDGEGDVDFFVFYAEEGMHYRIDVALGTLPGSDAALYHPDGFELAHNLNYDAASRIDWQADYTGEHYVAVRVPWGETGYTGTYTLTVTPVADHAGVLDRATSVSVGEAVPGVIYGVGDVDFFVFRAEQGMRYQIDVALGTLVGSTVTLFDENSVELAFNDDYDDTTSRIYWQAGYTGDHYLAVQSLHEDPGTYTLTVTLDAVLDDHADVSHWATSVSVGEAVLGVMDHDGDVDFLVFWAERGSRYQIDVALGTLPDSVLELHDAYGSKLTSNDGSGATAASRVHWQAGYTGDHYIAVKSKAGGTGTYTLSVASTDAFTFNAVTAGSSHTCGLRTDNTITCWGSNSYGRADPPPGAFSAVTAGSDHTCGLRTDNTITCWGDNDFGQTDAPSGAFKSVTAGSDHTCGLRTDNTITCWGNTDLGRADPPPGTFRSVTAGGHHTCGLRTDNTITCWGRNYNGQTDPPPGTFTAVALGGHHTCGLRTDNTITCWGWNDYGQADPPPGTFTAVALGGYHSCGLRTDDTVTCWGGDFSRADLPGSFKAIAAGWYHSCGLRTDNTITCWG